MESRWRPGGIQVESRWNSGGIQVEFRWNPGVKLRYMLKGRNKARCCCCCLQNRLFNHLHHACYHHDTVKIIIFIITTASSNISQRANLMLHPPNQLLLEVTVMADGNLWLNFTLHIKLLPLQFFPLLQPEYVWQAAEVSLKE